MTEFAGIGPRMAYEGALIICTGIAYLLADKGYKLRSGAAKGCDSAFELGCDVYGGEKKIFLPFTGYNGRTVSNNVVLGDKGSAEVDRIMRLSLSYSPKSSALCMHQRNMDILLDDSLENKVDFVVTPYHNELSNGVSRGGGTQQCVAAALLLEIPVYNLSDEKSRDEFSEKHCNISDAIEIGKEIRNFFKL